MSRAKYIKNWREIKGRAYMDERNDTVKQYHNTFWGRIALATGWINSNAKLRGVGGKIQSKDLMELWLKQNNINPKICICNVCKNPTEEWRFDHIKALKHNGEHAISNLQIICPNCDKSKFKTDMDAYSRPEQPEFSM